MTVPACLVAPMLGGRGSKTLTFQTSSSKNQNSSSYNFIDQAIGTAAGDRRVIVAIHAADAGVTITSVTIAGVAATEVIQATSTETTGIFIALVPTGTAGDVVVNMSGTSQRCAVAVWSCTGLTSGTPVDTGSSTADPGTDTLTTVNGGFCIAAGTVDGSTTTAWTNVTERYDDVAEALTTYSGADATTTGANISPSGDYAAAGAHRQAVFATW